MGRLKDTFSCRINPLGSSKSLWLNTGAVRRDAQEECLAKHSPDQHRGCFCDAAGVLKGEKPSQLKCAKGIWLLCASPWGVHENEVVQRESRAEKEWGWPWGGAAHWYLEPEHELALSAGLQSDYLESDLPRWMAEPCPPWWCLSV